MGRKHVGRKIRKNSRKSMALKLQFSTIFFICFKFQDKQFKLKNSQRIKKNPPVKKITPKMSITWVALFLTILWLADFFLSFGCFLSQEKLVHQTHKQKELPKVCQATIKKRDLHNELQRANSLEHIRKALLELDETQGALPGSWCDLLWSYPGWTNCGLLCCLNYPQAIGLTDP